MRNAADQNDFSKGKVWKHILNIAIPMTIAQLVQVLYNMVDRIYIGHLPGASSLALTGLGLTFPVITLISAFTSLFGGGGAPLCSIARGNHDEERAERIMGTTLTMLCATSLVLMAVSYGFLKPILYLFGASDASYPYARAYLLIYLIGTPFIMVGVGMNGFINAQGFARYGMLTISLGALLNIALDPLLIYVFHLGVSGAAIATVLSQLASALWVMRFLTGRKTLLRIRRRYLKPNFRLLREITALGFSTFIFGMTSSLVQIACNTMLRSFGGDVYVGIMTVLNSIRDFFTLPSGGITSGAQPVLGYNYGAKQYDRVKQGIRFTTKVSFCYMAAVWLIALLLPGALIRLFNDDPAMLAAGIPALRLYFSGFFMMTFHATGQAVFVALGQSKQATFFSLLRKVIIVVPLTLLLPHIPFFGVNGVFIAEPVSNVVSGIVCYITMLMTTRRLLPSTVSDGPSAPVTRP